MSSAVSEAEGRGRTEALGPGLGVRVHRGGVGARAKARRERRQAEVGRPCPGGSWMPGRELGRGDRGHRLLLGVRMEAEYSRK